ncbi:TRAP transporter small permease subunit [uncultured Tateyamaria sp.]|uniref:TRAP transporter small permease n=1 Tax=uncultured Tateyamaria sp. TaxID=455651 RepID=UPI002601B265|nr:TRAP transporter small permease subunit [uncultured Tateyamaria sp.]
MRALISLAGIAFGGTSVVVMMILSVADVASRALGAPMLGLKELSEVFLLVCVGAALPLAILGGRSIAIEGLVDRFPKRLRLAVTWAGIALSILMLAILGWSLVGASADARDFAETSALLLIPYAPLYLFLAVAHFVAAVAVAIHAFGAFRKDVTEVS